MIKKVIGKVVEFLTDEGFLGVLWYVLYVMWFGFTGRIIITSNQHIIVKILMIIGDLWWGFYVFISHYNSTSE